MTRTRSAANGVVTQQFDALNRLTQRLVDSISVPQQRCASYVAGPITNPNTLSGCLVVFPAYPNAANGAYTIARDTAVFAYDADGHLLTADNGSAKVHRQYFPSGAVKRDSLIVHSVTGTSFTQPYGLAVHYDLDARRDTLTLPGGSPIAYGYRADDGVLTSVTDPLANVYRYVYDVAGRIDSLTIGGTGVREKRWYDADSRQYHRVRTAAIQGFLSEELLTFDAQARVTKAGYASAVIGEPTDTTCLTYSGLGAVLARERRDAANNWETEEFRVDAFGNVIRALPGSRDVGTYRYPVLSTYASRGALTACDGIIPSSMQPYASDIFPQGFDLDGNTRVSQHQTRDRTGTYTRDTPSRTYVGGDERVRAIQHYDQRPGAAVGAWEEYRYDALGRRVLVIANKDQRPPGCDQAGISVCAALCSPNGCANTVTWQIWDGQQLIQEDRRPYENGSIAPPTYGTVQYLHGLELDKPLAMLNSDGTIRALNAHWRGVFESSVTPAGAGADCSLVTGSCPTFAWPAGQPVYARPTPVPSSTNPFTFAGTLLTDQQDATTHLYRRNRYYDPDAGRFTQEDPVGIAGGMNVYGFAGGDPVNFRDPIGLCPIEKDRIPCVAEYALGVTISSSVLHAALDAIAGEADRTLIVYGGDRTPLRNRAFGGAPASSHLIGEAADIIFEGTSKKETARILAGSQARKDFDVRLLYHQEGSTLPEHSHLDLQAGPDLMEQRKGMIPKYIPLKPPQ